ncbi:OmpA family protein [Nocardiopsis terrae]
MTPSNTSPQIEGTSAPWAGFAFSLMILTTSGCVIGSDTPPSENGENIQNPQETNAPNTENKGTEVLATSTATATELGTELQIDINALERLENDLLRLRISITNNSSERFDIGAGLAEDLDRLTASRISLIDDVNQQRYLSYEQSDGSCFCSTLEGPIDSGATEELWIIFPAASEDLNSMIVTTPLTPPLLDIPISSTEESVENNNLRDPQILDLTLISDSLEDDQTGRTESGDEVSIILSSDVLFDTNSSNLSDQAQEILEQVAQEIDDASSSIVSVDGYADNTGGENINVPLSKARAESVESTLKEIITREGVKFEVKGHGSAEPIADNTTKEGRERNRRVSVTFEK